MSKRILLVEDEAILAMKEKAILEKQGYIVDVASTGEQAIKQAGVYDLILMDINLGPGIDGSETAERILDVYDLPIVFLSSHTEKEMVDKVKNITNYGYIIKNSGEFVLIESIEMAFDLFEARRAEREKEQSFRSLFYHNNTIMFIVDPDTLCIIDANEAAVKYYGHEYSELVQMCLKDISIMPEHTIRGNVDESFRQTQNHFIVKHQIKSGEIRDVEVYSGPIYIDNSILLYITIYDITEKLEAVERFKNLFNFAPIGIFVTNSSGEIIDINNKMLDLLGYKHEEIQHLSALDIYNNPKERKELLDALIEHRRVENFQYLLKKKNNQTVYVSITARISKKLKNGDFIIEGFIEEVK